MTHDRSTTRPPGVVGTVVMAGPMPPAIGGMTSVLCDLANSKLRDSVELKLFDTGKQTPSGRSLFTAVKARWTLWRQWWALLGQARPAIVHIHTCSGLTYFLDGALLMLARLRGAAVVLHVHGGRFDRFLDELGSGALVARWLARRAARIVVLSPVWRERLEPLLKGARLAVVENGVPVPDSVAARASGPPFVAVFLGTLSEQKGVRDLIRAAAEVRSSFKGGSIKVCLVGPEGDSQFVADMRHLVRELDLQDGVEFAGPAYGDDKNKWLARAHMFVLPSHIEAFPISILEAMAAGVPVIATRVGAIPTMIDADDTGLLVNAGDVQGLARALSALAQDEKLRARLADRARVKCMQCFSIDRAAGALLVLYSEIMNSPPVADKVLR